MNRITGAILVLAAAILLPSSTKEDLRSLLFLAVGALGLGFLTWGLATERDGSKPR
jgi:hypothetical protein